MLGFFCFESLMGHGIEATRREKRGAASGEAERETRGFAKTGSRLCGGERGARMRQPAWMGDECGAMREEKRWKEEEKQARRGERRRGGESDRMRHTARRIDGVSAISRSILPSFRQARPGERVGWRARLRAQEEQRSNAPRISRLRDSALSLQLCACSCVAVRHSPAFSTGVLISVWLL